jgi:hypothetical protein
MPLTASRSFDLANGLLNTERHKYRPGNETTSKPSNCAIPEPPQSQPYKLSKRPHMKTKTIAVVNSSGRQAASFIRVASAVGYYVRAQLRTLDGIVATEISSLPRVTVFVGELSSSNARTKYINTKLITELFEGAQLAFINTTFWGDEVAIGKYLADAAKKAGVQHYIYSTMPDHSSHNPEWPELPLWSAKFKIESYIRSIGLPATFVYTGIYNNNFTSLPYPLFCMALQQDGTFVWQAPFHPNVKLPWLDAEHDVGPAVLQLIKDGVRKWSGQRIALAYEMLTPLEACRMFSRGVGRPVTYKRGPIEIKVPIPKGYREQLTALESLFKLENEDQEKQPPYFGSIELEKSCPQEALDLWEGFRGLEEYAREVFPFEEAANGLVWMNEDNGDEDDDEGDEDDVLTMGKRKEEEWLA